jgi:hypothetical protein
VIITAVSRDGGRSFTPPARIPPDSGYLQAVTHLLVLLDGAVLMPYVVNYERRPDGRYRGRIWVRRSTDGLSFSAAHPVAEYLSYGEAHGDLRWKGLGVTLMAQDRGRSRFAGNVYLTWAAPVGDRLQILVSRSEDGGRSWSTPLRVNAGGHASNHSTPAVAVRDDGAVVISWYDRRDDPEDNCFRPYVAVSFDGAHTFTGEREVADRATCPGSGSRWLNGGETHGLAALPDGTIRIVWSAGTAGDLRLWTAVLRPAGRIEK